MQKFLLSVFLATGASWVIFLFFLSRTSEESLIVDFLFSFFLFWTLSFSLSLIFYFGRIFLGKFLRRKHIRLADEEQIDLRPLWRRSFQMAAIISAFVSFLAFLKLEDQLTFFNLIILAAIIILGAVFLRTSR